MPRCRSSAPFTATHFCVAVLIFFFELGAQAESRYIDLAFSFEGTPKDVLFLVEEPEGAMLVAHGLFVPVLAHAGVPKRWRGGALVNGHASNMPIRFYVLVLNSDGKYMRFPENGTATPGETSVRDPDALREYLIQRKEVLKSWQMQIQVQEDSLARLRADAEVIGSLGKIVEVQDEIEKTKKSIRDLEGDMENLQYFLKASHSSELPINYAAREAQLTKQIAELAAAAKFAESSELKRSSLTQAELQRKLALVESTRGEDYDGLQRDLLRLRSKRMALQQDGEAPPAANVIDILD